MIELAEVYAECDRSDTKSWNQIMQSNKFGKFVQGGKRYESIGFRKRRNLPDVLLGGNITFGMDIVNIWL